ncbi:MAG: acetyltransferase [Campylobacterales bacterium]|nr:acetyltransferase [Campylobacterales bacterium]
MNKKIFIYGDSGHGKVVASIAKRCGYEVVGFIDDSESPKEILNFKSVSFDTFLQNFSSCYVALGIGNNKIRCKIFNKLALHEIKIATLIDPSAVVCESAFIDVGSVVMPLCVVNSEAKVGRGVILNSSSVIEHDNVIGDFVHISPKVAIAGAVSVGEFSHIGIGSSVIQCLNIGKNVVVGAGGVVCDNLESDSLYVGVPAKKIKTIERVIC